MQTKWRSAARREAAEPSAVDMRLGKALGQAARQWRRAVDRRLQRYDLTEATWRPLVHLDRAAEPMRQKDLAAELALDSSSIVRILNNLEAAGLIERDENEDDRRAKAIVITRSGRALVRRVEGVSRELEGEILAGLAPLDIATTKRVLAQICRMLDL